MVIDGALSRRVAWLVQFPAMALCCALAAVALFIAVRRSSQSGCTQFPRARGIYRDAEPERFGFYVKAHFVVAVLFACAAVAAIVAAVLRLRGGN